MAMSKIKAGMIGLLVGVATGATAFALSDKNTRKKVRRALEDAKDTTVDFMDSVEKTSRPLRKEARLASERAGKKIEELQKARHKQMA